MDVNLPPGAAASGRLNAVENGRRADASEKNPAKILSQFRNLLDILNGNLKQADRVQAFSIPDSLEQVLRQHLWRRVEISAPCHGPRQGNQAGSQPSSAHDKSGYLRGMSWHGPGLSVAVVDSTEECSGRCCFVNAMSPRRFRERCESRCNDAPSGGILNCHPRV